MNKTYQELCDEVVLLREQLQAAQQQAADYRQTLEQMEAEEGQEIADLKEQLDTAQLTVIQTTASAVNWRNRCRELEEALHAGLPRPMDVRRMGDMSIELTFHSCRLAGEFERLITPGEEHT